MKTIVRMRQIDELGRVLIPREMRNRLTLQQNDTVSVSCIDDTITIQKADLSEQPKNVFMRKMDKLGRIVLPKELRQQMGLKIMDYLKLSCDDDMITAQYSDTYDLTGQEFERQTDKLGRVVIPREVREYLGFHNRDLLDFSADGNMITVTKSRCADETQEDEVPAQESSVGIDVFGRVLLKQEVRTALDIEPTDAVTLGVISCGFTLLKYSKISN